jgi:hypothetical protein
LRAEWPGIVQSFRRKFVVCAGFACLPALAISQSETGSSAKDGARVEGGRTEGESHHVQDALETGARKVGDTLNTGAKKVGPAIDHGVEVAKKAVEKSADAVGTALQDAGKKIEEKVGTQK